MESEGAVARTIDAKHQFELWQAVANLGDLGQAAGVGDQSRRATVSYAIL